MDAQGLEAQLIRPIDPGLGLPKLVLHGFGDVGYEAQWTHLSDGSNEDANHFALGSVDLMLTSALSRDFSFLVETAFHFVGTDAEIDVERLLLMYEFRDWLKVNLGRGHSAIGYWNQRYHHGRWLQTTIARPLVYDFEHDGGILPVHFTGAEVFGNVDVKVGMIRYSVFLSNGRGEQPDQIQVTQDFNPAKAPGFLLRFSPDAWSASGIGVSGYFDEIPPVDGEPARAKSMREYIYGAHVFFVEGPWEVLSEASFVIHEDRVEDEQHRSAGAYAQAAYRVGKFKPYYRFDWLDVAEDDPFYAGSGSDQAPPVQLGETKLHTLGIRWDVRTFVAFKVEYRYRAADDGDSNEIGLQASFAF